MAFEKLRPRKPSRAPGVSFKVVAHHPWRRSLLLMLLAVVVASGSVLGFWLGRRTGELDHEYLAALQTRSAALESRVDSLTRDLADSRLTATIDAEAARSLRETISDLRDRAAGLREEVTFYKSLMAPSSVERGLQIAEFELEPGMTQNQFTYRILLTQAAERRSWVQGSVKVDVRGVRPGDHGHGVEEVLPLTDLTDAGTYPLKFRFRYFQNLSGTLTLPEGFRPLGVVITMSAKGRSGDPATRSYDWNVQTG